MKYQVLDRIFNKHKATRKFERLELDQNFHILDVSEQVQRFAAHPKEVIPGKDVRLSFPEFTGLEDVLISILEGKQELFELEGIGRYEENKCDLYIDIYIIGKPSQKKSKDTLIILFEDVTDRIVLEQKLSQRINEIKLLSSVSCTYINKTAVEGLEDIVYVGRDITDPQRRQQRICVQYAISRILSESQSVKQVVPQILQAICESLGWDLAELWSSNQYITASQQQRSMNPVLRCVEIWSSRTVAFREFKAITWQTTYTPGVGLPGQIWATRSPLWMKDVVNDSDLRLLQSAAESGLHTAFGIPILDNNEILGVMIFFSQEVQPKDADVLEMMVSISNQIAHFIKHKRASKYIGIHNKRI